MNALLNPIVQSAQFYSHLAELQRIAAEEQQKRAAFYDQITEQQKVEFIRGEVVLHSPVAYEHEQSSSGLYALLSLYVRKHKLGYLAHEKLMVSLSRNDYEPDICFFGADKAAGFQPGQKLFPAPDFIVEVLSPSTERTDRGVKMEDYAAHGVAEYWLADPRKRTVEQYLLTPDGYELAFKSDHGEATCQVLSGLSLPVVALFDSDAAWNMMQVLMR